MQLHSKKIAVLGLLSALGLILGYIESLITIPFRIPGMKLGLSNCITVILLYIYGPLEAVVVLVVRVLLSSLMFGNGFSLLYSISGALFSFLCMRLVYKWDKLSMVGVSILGGVSHNIAQLAVAMFLVRNCDIIAYLPYLIFAGIGAGLIVGFTAVFVSKRTGFLFNERG